MTKKRVLAAIAGTAITFLPLIISLTTPVAAQAAVSDSDWAKGAVMVAQSPTDFGSASFQQSLENLHATGANSVELVVQYYQSNTGSTDVQAGWNTTTDASLASAIDEAHALGMKVLVAMHIDTYDGSWRAYINPGDRDGWFNNYGAVLLDIAKVAQAHHAEAISIGTELVSMTNDNINSTNTAHWDTLIGEIRQVYSGQLTYGANSTDDNYDYFEDEKAYVHFWNLLDFAGLSSYVALNSDDSVQSLENDWNTWEGDMQGFSQAIGKPIVFTEIGYRSLSGAQYAPWNWQEGGSEDDQTQANLYDALLGFWNNYSFMQGVYFWNWSTSPNTGGGNTDYTPQGKAAQQVMTKWFTNPNTGGNSGGTSGGGSTAGTFSVTASAPAASVGQAATIPVTVKDSAAGSALVDVEIYNSAGTRIFQQFYDNQSFTAGQTLSFNSQWTPSVAGSYKVEVGVFSPGWATNYLWSADAADGTVSAQNSGGGGTSGGGSTSAGTFTITGSATPTSSGATLSTSVKDSAAGSALVDMEVYNSSGSKVFQQFYDNQSFSAGQTLSFSTPAALPAGTYKLEVGVFAPGWAQVYAWNGDAADFTVSASGSGSGNNGGSGSNDGSGSNGGSGSNNPPPPSGSASIDQNGQSVNAGGSLDFTGRGFAHEETVTITLNGSQVGSAHADGGGNFSTGSINAPKTAGSYTYTFAGSSGDSATATITVH